MKRLKREREEDELTGVRLAAVRLSFGWRRMDLGEILNSAQFIGSFVGGAQFGRATRRPEVKRITGARESLSHVVASSPALIRQQWGFTAMECVTPLVFIFRSTASTNLNT
jgi:hypothetical protein